MTAVPSHQTLGTFTGSVLSFSSHSAALAPDRVVDSACQFCNSNCRLQVATKAGRIVDIRGEARDPVQAGALCVKGPMMAELTYSGDRLTTPLRRVSGAKGSPESTFEAISWDEALDTIAIKMLELRDAGEAHAIANRTTGRLPRGVGSLVDRLFELLGSPNASDVGPTCNDAGGNALSASFGLGNFTNGYGVDHATGDEDLGSAKYFLFLGTNQAETHPVTFDYLLRSRAVTGAKLVVLDPRKTPTGAEADEWLAPKPHTDLAFVLALLHEIVTKELYDRQFVENWTLGFDELREHVVRHGYTAAWAEQVTGIPADSIVRVAREFATAKPAAIFCNAGISHQLNAFDTYRALTFLAAITGNVGVLGGGCNFMHNTWPGDLKLPPLPAPGPAVRAQALPVGPDYFAESILTGTPYRLKLVLTEGNPLISSANTNKVRDAYAALDFYVYIGLFKEEAAYYADIVLPVCGGLEFEGVYMRRDDRAIRWQDQVIPPIGEAKPEWELWIDLARALARNEKTSDTAWNAAFPDAWRDFGTLWDEFVAHTPGMGGMTRQRMHGRAEPLRWPCPTEDHPGVSALYLDHPSWYEAAESLGAQNRGKRFLTPSGQVEIFTPALESQLRSAGHGALPIFYTHPEVTGTNPTVRYSSNFVTNPINPQAVTQDVELGADAGTAIHQDFPLMGTTGRPSVVHFASATHWTQTGKQLNGVRLIQIHPETAAAHGIADGDDIVVESPRGAVTGTALLWQDIRPDTIFVPNTFGPAQELGDRYAAPRYAATNTLVDDRYYDNLSGQQAYKCFACRIAKANPAD